MQIHFSELAEIGYVPGVRVRSTTICHTLPHGNKLSGEIGTIVEGVLRIDTQLGPTLAIRYTTNPENKEPDTELILIVGDEPIHRTKKKGLIVSNRVSICFLELLP